MLPWIRSAAAKAAAGLPALLTLGLLAAVGVWGARNDWTLPSLAQLWGKPAATNKDAAEEAPRVVTAPPARANRVKFPSRAGPPSPRGRPRSTAGAKRVEFPSADAVQKSGIRWERAEVRTLSQYVTATGAIDYEPSVYARLTPRASGTVWRVYKEIGQTLRKGDVLALIDSAEVGRAKADFLQSLAQVKVRSTTVERLRSAGREGAVPERLLREAEAALREARIRLFNDQQALLNLGLPVRVGDVEDLPEEQQVRRLRLLGLPDDVTRELDTDTLTANLLPLTAPFDSVVVQRDAAPGEVIEGRQPRTLFVVADVRQLHIDLDVNPEDMAEVRVGQAVTFTPDGGKTEATAKVSHISPEVDEKTRRVTVHAEVANLDGRLRPNAFGTGHIILRERPGAVVIPNEAIQPDGSTSLIFVRVSDTAFEVRPVETGLHEGNLVEVRGVRPGEEVVTTGSFALKSELLKDRITGGDE
jgi:cobalt-zinc-cadmium efflux system membrane fusion protein